MHAKPFEQFVANLIRVFSIDADDVGAGTGLYDDLGMDSIDAMRLLIVLEEWAAILLPPEEIPVLLTVGDAYEYYVSLCEYTDAMENDPRNMVVFVEDPSTGLA
jgi:acyl carrier protein